jgi:hypothetical protein
MKTPSPRSTTELLIAQNFAVDDFNRHRQSVAAFTISRGAKTC